MNVARSARSCAVAHGRAPMRSRPQELLRDGWMASVVFLCARTRARASACVRLSESVCLGVLRKRICVQGVRRVRCAMCVRRCEGDCACFHLCAARCVHPPARRIRLCAREGPSECVCLRVAVVAAPNPKSTRTQQSGLHSAI
jgi:hypothetical protein